MNDELDAGAEATATIGRPRDRDVDRRALVTAVEVYGELGWSGFTFGKVAERARVGKSSLYRRWPTKGDLLLAALNEVDAFYAEAHSDVAELPFLERVHRIVRHRLRSYFAPAGIAVIRLNLEHLTDPAEMGQIWVQSVGRAVRRTRALLNEGIVRGDLIAATSVVQLGDALEGGMTMHALATPTSLRPLAVERLDEYATEFVERTLGPWLTPRATGGRVWSPEAGALVEPPTSG
ncbi:TetR family transcriptional regulator [Salana multivorans]|uniref:TetR family transcriptional regulator n=1 Tax=Salana multivorans TaxID=120377 RepID=A0A3N2DDB5_9MICO|nr:MAG: hypothetical protein BGO96_14475 [Micrococcales bacterium 73-15]ROR97727.1 TetR family transcriptional regulator [Salana multivorans]